MRQQTSGCAKTITEQLCFSQIYELHRIFPPNGQPNQLLVKKIGYCIEIGITFVKDSNACICTKCVGLIEEFFRFKQLCSANEQWLKSDHHGHVATSAHPGPDVDVQEQGLLVKSHSCSSLLTIETEQVNTSDDYCETTLNGTNSFIERPEKSKNLNESANTEVSSSGRSMRARKPTTMIAPSNQFNEVSRISVKSEIQSDVEEVHETDSAEYSTEGSDFSIEQSSSGSDVFQLVRGSKSRSNLQYLVYHGYRYSNKNNGKIWRCTHHAPICCKAMVMLEKNRVIELNHHFHNHPPPTKPRMKTKPNVNDDNNVKPEKNVKISLVLKKEKNTLQRVSKMNNISKQGQPNNWFIKANRKTVDGFTYTFCGLRKDGVIRLKCITKNCAGRIYVNSNGDLLRTNKEHCHPPHSSHPRLT
ncbi:uncharacterized protein LOC131695792 [Topomyia yanbarensis]|uniref:uncharacterized protein LOC131695792 n=1 Tax=Topomyia yanbarensis TaxID=2498891 RepID=UPI00273C8528|nr:uncharacterized protein LOC131695792 [Topomyia yanbarensis]